MSPTNENQQSSQQSKPVARDIRDVLLINTKRMQDMARDMMDLYELCRAQAVEIAALKTQLNDALGLTKKLTSDVLAEEKKNGKKK